MAETRKNLINHLKPFIETTIVIQQKKYLLFQEDFNEKIFILLTGKYKLTHNIPNFKEFTLGHYINTGIILPCFCKNKNFFSLFRIEALDTCIFGIVSINKLNNLPTLKNNLIKYTDLLSQKIFLQMRDLIFNNKLTSLYSILIRLSNTYGIPYKRKVLINLTLTNLELAKYIGTTPETISRLLSKLKNNNLIEIKNKKILLNNITYMKQVLNCYNCNEKLCEF